MPPPPPPRLPPPPDAPPEPKPFKPAKSSACDPNDVFKQINKGGFKLKKTVTVDKSGPYIPGKANSNNNNNNSSSVGKGFSNRSPANNTSTSQSSAPNGVINFGDLFAGGIPTLKPTGLRPTGGISPGGGTTTESTNNKSKETINNLLRKQVAARGPPPQPPSTNPSFPSTSKNIVNDDRPVNRFNSNNKLTSDLGEATIVNKSADSVDSTIKSRSGNIVANNSSLHGNISNSGNLNENNNSVSQRTKLINHGKPNLAPKPPGVKPSPPPKNNLMNGRIAVNRTQSMRMSRSPPVTPTSPFASPFNGNEFNTLRNVSTLHQSHEALNRRNPVTPTRNNALLNQHIGRPTQPPPSRPPQTKPPPPPRTGSSANIIPPQSPPPPPPSLSRVAPPPPTHSRVAPPPPPPIHARATPQNSGPPEPPQRGSSMRNGIQISAASANQEFDSRYFFHPVSEFPLPDVFKKIQKQYCGTGSKQQAPSPPNAQLQTPLPANTQLQLGKKLWSGGDSSNC